MPIPAPVIDARTTKPCGEEVIEFLEKMHLPPTPANYEVCFHYLSEKNKPLSAEMDVMIHDNVEFTPEVIQKLHQKHLSIGQHSEEEKLNVMETMNQLMVLIKEFSQKNKDHNTKLEEHSDSLTEKAKDNSDLESVISEVVEQLEHIKDDNNHFTDQLKSSEKEIAELRDNLNKAKLEARIDGLTKLFNRRAFDELIQQHTQEATELDNDLCLLFIDIDHFKNFNDEWGHQIGDEVLKVVSGAIRRTVRGQDIVARYGGEEFAVLLPDTPPNGAQIVSENIRKLIANNRLRRKNSTEEISQITVSIGIARHRNDDPHESIKYFIERADNALYKAKENGRNRVTMEL